MEFLRRRLARLPVWMACLRILDLECSSLGLKDLPPPEPDPVERIRYLGRLMLDKDEDSARDLERDLRRTCGRLAQVLVDQPQVSELLLADTTHPAWRLAEAIVLLMGEKHQFGQYRNHLDSCLIVNEVNGLARKRRTTVRGILSDRRSLALSNTALDYLVHRHLRKAKRGTGIAAVSLVEFLAILQERYGFFIDSAPPGMLVSSELLRRNRGHLERRLRDMGLLLGVNDAESMKRLAPRFEAQHV